MAPHPAALPHPPATLPHALLAVAILLLGSACSTGGCGQKPAPPPGPPPPECGQAAPPGAIVFSAAGDLGANARSDAALRAIAGSGSAFFVGLGDMSYDEVTPEASFCGYVQRRLGATFPFQLVGGNHEDDRRFDGHTLEFAACLPDRMGSSGEYGREYYFDHGGLVRVIAIAANLKIGGVTYDYLRGNDHHRWLEAAIDGARAAGIPWVVVAMHKNCITVGNKPCEIGTDLLELLIEKRVDLVLQGHDHNYQRSKQLRCAFPNRFDAACVSDDGADGAYERGKGTVFAIAGAVGRDFYPINPADPELGYFAAAQSGTSGPEAGRGFLRFVVSPNRLDATLCPTGGASWTDRFSIAAP